MMPAWTRAASEERSARWARANDISTTLKEVERSRKDLIKLMERPGTVDPYYLRKREMERARAEQAAQRLESQGVSVTLPPFAFRQPEPPSVIEAASASTEPEKPKAEKKPVEVVKAEEELKELRSELEMLKQRNSKLEVAVQAYRERREEEHKSWEVERLKMARVVARLRDEVEIGWNRIISLRASFQAELQRPGSSQSGRLPRRQMLMEDDVYEGYRPSSRMSLDPRRYAEEETDSEYEFSYHAPSAENLPTAFLGRRPGSRSSSSLRTRFS